MRADLALMWSPTNRAGNMRRIPAKASSLVPSNERDSILAHERSTSIDEDNTSIRVRMLVATLVPYAC